MFHKLHIILLENNFCDIIIERRFVLENDVAVTLNAHFSIARQRTLCIVVISMFVSNFICYCRVDVYACELAHLILNNERLCIKSCTM